MRKAARRYRPFIETPDGDIVNIETDIIPNLES